MKGDILNGKGKLNKQNKTIPLTHKARALDSGFCIKEKKEENS